MAKSTKIKSTKKRVKVGTLAKTDTKLSKKEMTRVKGGLLPFIGQSNIQDGTSNIQDGTSNTILKK
jgi:hypothetical protein